MDLRQAGVSVCDTKLVESLWKAGVSEGAYTAPVECGRRQRRQQFVGVRTAWSAGGAGCGVSCAKELYM